VVGHRWAQVSALDMRGERRALRLLGCTTTNTVVMAVRTPARTCYNATTPRPASCMGRGAAVCTSWKPDSAAHLVCDWLGVEERLGG
jgi:hypothetical protein